MRKIEKLMTADDKMRNYQAASKKTPGILQRQMVKYAGPKDRGSRPWTSGAKRTRLPGAFQPIHHLIKPMLCTREINI